MRRDEVLARVADYAPFGQPRECRCGSNPPRARCGADLTSREMDSS
jgi:hypothetical protein